MKVLKRLSLVLLIVFIVAQCFAPEKNDGYIASVNPFIADTRPPEDVAILLKNACFDCHSDYTRYPWYNTITPVNYWLSGHVNHGKAHFNVSKWNDYSNKKKDYKLKALIETVGVKTMPLKSYTWMHRNANLSQEQIDKVITWAKHTRLRYMFLKEPL